MNRKPTYDELERAGIWYASALRLVIGMAKTSPIALCDKELQTLIRTIEDAIHGKVRGQDGNSG